MVIVDKSERGYFMTVRLLCCTVILALVVTAGCSLGDNTPGKEPNDNDGNNVLQGYSLDEVGLELDVRELRLFEDHNQKLISYDTVHYPSGHRYAETTGLVMEFSEKNGVELLLCLQGFKKDTSSEAQEFIQIDSSQYSLSDLGQHKVYEDDEVVVYDLTDLVGVNFIDKVQDWVEDDLPFQWMEEVYDYVKSYNDIVITKKAD